ncbi:MAG: LysR family transcriptional regulator [Treponema sp.]|jgi:DNA-binding transcriptional LysR family regulator|nr:LysR family transcriptional regulator [Treponema sp.]
MNFLDVRYFLEIVNNGLSFTKTSQKLYISQPALTKHINNLNKDLEAKLFETGNKTRVRLTPAGRLYYNFFSECAENFFKTKIKAKEIETTLWDEIQVCCVEGWEPNGVLREIDDFNRIYPNIKISLSMTNFNDIKTGILNGQYDLAFSLRYRYEGIEEFTIKDMFKIPRILLFSSRHPLAQKEELTLRDFKDYPQYVYNIEEEPASIVLKEQYCKSKGFIPFFETVPNLDSLFIAMERGTGYAIFINWIWQKNNPSFKYIELDNIAVVSAVWRKDNHNKALKLFLDHLRFLD